MRCDGCRSIMLRKVRGTYPTMGPVLCPNCGELIGDPDELTEDDCGRIGCITVLIIVVIYSMTVYLGAG